jgi:hypothetical protein
MGHRRVLFSVVGALLLPLCCPAQRKPQRDPQAVAIIMNAIQAVGGPEAVEQVQTMQTEETITPGPGSDVKPGTALLLQRAYAALSAGNPLNDITLTGTARRIAGSDDETGTAVVKATATGASRMDLTLPSGQRSEIQNSSGASPAGAWSGPDGMSHTTAFHNLLTEPAWFFPAFLLARGLSASGYVANYVGRETKFSTAVEHLTIHQSFFGLPADMTATFQHLSQVDLYLDSTTFLPIALGLNVHPDDNELLDIPIEIRFSDYRVVNRGQVPFHVQKFLNNGLILDLQFQNVTLNAGLTASSFSM